MPNLVDNTIQFNSLEDLEKVVAFTSQISSMDCIYKIDYLGTRKCILRNIGVEKKGYHSYPMVLKLRLEKMYIIGSVSDIYRMLDIRKEFSVGDYIQLSRVRSQVKSDFYFNVIKDNDLTPYISDFNFNIIKPQGMLVFDYERKDLKSDLKQPLDHPSFWYNWNIENWGTKSKAFDIFVDRENYTIEFQTAWNGVPNIMRCLALEIRNTKFNYSCIDENGKEFNKSYYLEDY